MTLVGRLVMPFTLLAFVTGCSSASTDPSTGGETASYNNTDVMFTQMMIPHHGDAIAMADFLLEQDGVTPEITDLATDIATGQRAENQEMNAWLGDTGQGEVDLQDKTVDTQSVEQASVDEIETAFLTEMIAHHEHGVQMSSNEAESGESPVIVDLAEAMTADQSAEIDLMRSMLDAG